MRWISAPLRSRLARVGQLLAHGPFHRLTRLKIRSRQCRFVVSDDSTEAISCGASTLDGSSWCPWHRQRGYASPQSKGKICRGVPFWRRGSCEPRIALAAIGARITPAPVQPWQPLCPRVSCLLSPMSKPACASGTWPAMQAHWGRSPLSRCKGFLGTVSKGQAAGSANQATLVVRSRVRCLRQEHLSLIFCQIGKQYAGYDLLRLR